ncbi:hypothetical protein Tco_1516277 [Tanacetum coccineum]
MTFQSLINLSLFRFRRNLVQNSLFEILGSAVFDEQIFVTDDEVMVSDFVTYDGITNEGMVTDGGTDVGGADEGIAGLAAEDLCVGNKLLWEGCQDEKLLCRH